MIDLQGQVFGRLRVVGEAARIRPNVRRWACVCECGEKCSVNQYNLTSGKTKSCGCIRLELTKNRSTTHGLSKTKTWCVWQSMISRCYHSGATSFERYGAVGITVCQRWKEDYLNFLHDMGETPEGLTLERVNGARVYSPETCVWASTKDQALSRRTTIWVEHNGQRLCLKDWAVKLNLPYLKLYKRYVVRGWDFQRSITN
jgi:hypothetical protein